MTLDIMHEVKYDGAYMFKYSPREKTKAWQMNDDVDEEIKTKRLMEIIELQNKISLEKNTAMVGQSYEILIEGRSKKSVEMMTGRTDGNKSYYSEERFKRPAAPRPQEKNNGKINRVNLHFIWQCVE
jgi:tRNA-2-methylthio-N6-dimethylallyladenosine synthase